MAATRGNPTIVLPADAGSTMIYDWDATVNKPQTVVGIRWTGATDASHQAIIQDKNGRTMWEAKASTAGLGIAEESTIRWRSRGLKVTTLGSGILYIYLADDV